MQSTKVAVIFLVLLLPACSMQLESSDGLMQPDKKGRPSYKEWKRQKDREAAEAAKAAAVDNSLPPEISKVVELLDNLKAETMSEGEKEAAWYNKFACFCKDVTAARTQSITEFQAEIARLRGLIFGDAESRAKLDADAARFGQEMNDANSAKAAAEAGKNQAFKVFRFNEAQMVKAISSLEEALTIIKSKRTRGEAAFLQKSDEKNLEETLQEASFLADALGFKGATGLASFLQGVAPKNEVNMENYKFHSEGIITILEGLQQKFVQQKREIDARYAAETAAFDGTIREKTYYVAIKQNALDATTGQSAEEANAIAQLSAELTIAEARLYDDQVYLAELTQTCSDKARTWGKRSQVRADELTALQAVVNVMSGLVADKYKGTYQEEAALLQSETGFSRVRELASNDQVMEALEASVEGVSLLQLVQDSVQHQVVTKGGAQQVSAGKTSVATSESSALIPAEGQQKLVDFLRNQGNALKSTVLVHLATTISGPETFTKVKTLITELIDRLLQEESNESGQKSWCDKAMQDAKMKRDYAAQDIDRLNSKMQNLEAQIEDFRSQITDSGLPDEIAELRKQQREADDMRHDEETDNHHTINQAELGLKGVKMAKDIIWKFYAVSDVKAQKQMLPASLLQESQVPKRRPTDEQSAIEAEDERMSNMEGGFTNGEHYKGGSGAAQGIIEMLDVIIHDFKKTITETKASDKQSAKEHLDFTTEIQKSLQVKETALSGFTDQNSDANKELFDSDQDLVRRNNVLGEALSELLELQPACVDTGMTFEERAAARESEITSLNRALCIFKNLKRGPDDQEEC